MNKEFCWRFGAVVLSALALLASRSPVDAAVVITSRSSFESQLLPGFYQETFENITPRGLKPDPMDLSGNGYSYSITTPGAGDDLWINQTVTTYTRWLSTETGNDDIQITFTGGVVTAVGGTFFLTGLDERSLAGTVTVTLNDGTTANVSSAAQGAASQPFVGFFSAVPITSLTITGPDGTFVGFDNFTVGAVVPEPLESSLAAAACLLAVAFARNRRRSAARK